MSSAANGHDPDIISTLMKDLILQGPECPLRRLDSMEPPGPNGQPASGSTAGETPGESRGESPREESLGAAVGGAADAAEAASDSVALDVVARSGFAVMALLHIVIGAIAVALVFGAPGQAEPTGAIEQLSANPWGPAVMWAAFIACAGLSLWQLSDRSQCSLGVLARRPPRPQQRDAPRTRLVLADIGPRARGKAEREHPTTRLELLERCPRNRPAHSVEHQPKRAWPLYVDRGRP